MIQPLAAAMQSTPMKERAVSAYLVATARPLCAWSRDARRGCGSRRFSAAAVAIFNLLTNQAYGRAGGWPIPELDLWRVRAQLVLANAQASDTLVKT